MSGTMMAALLHGAKDMRVEIYPRPEPHPGMALLRVRRVGICGSSIVQIGTLGTQDIPLPANLVMNREIEFTGSFRYGNVFDEAIRLVSSARVDLRPLVSGTLPLQSAAQAMIHAADKSQALKVQIQIQ